MRKNNWKEVGAAFFLLAGFTSCQPKPAPVRQFLRWAETTNQTCPQHLNETVTLDSTRYDETQNAVYYYYTANGVLDNPDYMQQNKASFQQALEEAVENSVEMKEYREYGTTFHYVYYSQSNGQPLAEFSFRSSSTKD